MPAWRQQNSLKPGFRVPQRSARERGQALIEFSVVALMLICMMFAVIDVSRAIYVQQIITHLTREGSNLAARGTTLANAVSAVESDAAPLDITTAGYVIVTSIQNTGIGGTVCGSGYTCSQATGGGMATTPGSKVWNGGATTPTLPTGIPAAGQTSYVTEVFYQFTPVTPIGSLLKLALPTTMYDVAYF